MADRTVTAKLKANVTDYVAGLKTADKATQSVTDELKDAARAGKDFGSTTALASAKAAAGMKVASAAANDLGDELGDASRAAGRLDARILESKQVIAGYAREIARTTDDVERNNLWKALTREQAKMRKDIKVRDLLPDSRALNKVGQQAGAQIATGMSGGLVDSLRSLGPVGTSFGVAIGIQVATAAAPFVAAALAGAITAGVGAGVLGLGAVIAAQDQRVQAAAGQLGRTLKEEFTKAAQPLVEPLIQSLGTLEQAGANLAPQFRNLFGDLAPSVEKLTDGLIGLAENAMPGITKAVEAFGPIADMLSRELPELGQDFSVFFDSISQGSEGGGQALSDFLDVVGGTIRAFGYIIEGGARAYKIFRDLITDPPDPPQWVKDLATALFPLTPLLTQAAGALGNMGHESDGTVNLMKPLAGTTAAIGKAARDSAADLRGFADAVREQSLAVLGASNSNIAFEQAIDDAAAAAKRGKKGIDDNTQAGRENHTALNNLAAAAIRVSQDILTAGGSQDDATAAMERGRAKFLATATAMGVGSKEAKELANKLFGLPKKVNPKVEIDTKKPKTAVEQIQAKINALHGKHIPITLDTVLGQSSISLGNLLHHRWGGIDYHMAAGGALQAGFVKSPTVLFGERETGGEAFIPKNGDPARNLAIWKKVGTDWLGMREAPRWFTATPSAGPAAPPAAAGPQWRPGEFAREIRAAMTGVHVVMDGRVVGQVQGREADLLSRGG